MPWSKLCEENDILFFYVRAKSSQIVNDDVPSQLLVCVALMDFDLSPYFFLYVNSYKLALLYPSPFALIISCECLIL